MTDEIVGYLFEGEFYCPGCAEHLWWGGGPRLDKLCPVYRVNIGIYSQECSACVRLVVKGPRKADGSGPLNLYEVM